MARLIASFNQLRAQVSVHDHRTIVNGHADHIRHLFSNVLTDNIDKLSKEYFLADDDWDVFRVQPKAIAVIFTFLDEGLQLDQNPLASVDARTLIARGCISEAYDGVREYLADFEDYASLLEQGDKARSNRIKRFRQRRSA